MHSDAVMPCVIDLNIPREVMGSYADAAPHWARTLQGYGHLPGRVSLLPGSNADHIFSGNRLLQASAIHITFMPFIKVS